MLAYANQVGTDSPLRKCGYLGCFRNSLVSRGQRRRAAQNAFFAETVAALQAELGKEGLQVILRHYSEREEENLVCVALSLGAAPLGSPPSVPCH